MPTKNKLNAHRRCVSTYITPRFHRRGTPQHPKNAKRTQFQHTQHPATPHFCKTNPISAPPPLPRSKMRNKPNLPPRHTALRQKCETNPISSHQYTFYNLQYTIQWPNLPCRASLAAPAHPQKCETNPIPHTAGVSPAFPPLIMRNKPNLPVRAGRGPPQQPQTNPK